MALVTDSYLHLETFTITRFLNLGFAGLLGALASIIPLGSTAVSGSEVSPSESPSSRSLVFVCCTRSTAGDGVLLLTTFGRCWMNIASADNLRARGTVG